MPDQSKRFLQRWVVDTLAVLVAANVVDGISYDTVPTLLAASLLLGVLNAVLRPVMLLLSLPLLLFTLGLFTLVINAGLLYLVGTLIKSFEVRGFGVAFKGALVISLVSLVINALLGGNKAKVEVKAEVKRGGPRNPGPPSVGGGGPVIDV